MAAKSCEEPCDERDKQLPSINTVLYRPLSCLSALVGLQRRFVIRSQKHSIFVRNQEKFVSQEKSLKKVCCLLYLLLFPMCKRIYIVKNLLLAAEKSALLYQCTRFARSWFRRFVVIRIRSLPLGSQYKIEISLQ